MIENNTNILLIEAENKNYWRSVRFYFGSTNLDKSICHNWNKDNAGTQTFSWIKFLNFHLFIWNAKTKYTTPSKWKRGKNVSLKVQWPSPNPNQSDKLQNKKIHIWHIYTKYTHIHKDTKYTKSISYIISHVIYNKYMIYYNIIFKLDKHLPCKYPRAINKNVTFIWPK